MTTKKNRARLSLFWVTLPWHPHQPEIGTYSDEVWAAGHEDAKRNLAKEMAAHNDFGCGTNKERKAFVDNLLASGKGESVNLSEALPDDITKLLTGPTGVLSEDASKDLQAIKLLLSKYGSPALL